MTNFFLQPNKRFVGLAALVCVLVALSLAPQWVSTTSAAPSQVLTDTGVFINEFHYDNDGTDTGEFIEIAGPAGTDLTNWSIVLYNGNGGGAYDTINLSGTLADAGSGFGFNVTNFPSNGIQNGPDGIALVNDSGVVVLFLSYEGSFTATDGAASGQTSTDIGVEEPFDTPAGQSLQLTGTGDTYGDFTWASVAAVTSGAANNNQTFAEVIDNAPPVVVSRSPQNLAQNVDPATSTLSITFNENIFEGNEDFRLFELTNQQTPVFDATVDADNYDDTGNTLTVTLTNFSLAPNTDYYVEMNSGAVEDIAGNAFPGFTGTSGMNSWTFSTGDVVPPCTGGNLTFISAIQGTGSTSPLMGNTVTVEGVVVGDYQATGGADGDFGGFFLQEEDADADANTATSEGIFVYDPNTTIDVANGDVVRVTGIVAEDGPASAFDDMTQLTDVSIEACGTTDTVTPAVVTFPLNNKERYEGMLVNITDTLIVTEFFELGRFGRMLMAFNGDNANEGPNGRIGNFTQYNDPDVSAYAAFQADKDARTIFLDDGSDAQNPSVVPFGEGTANLGPNTPVRGGATVAPFSGVFAEVRGRYTIQKLGDGSAYNITNAVARPTTPPVVDGEIKVVAANILNYFETLDDGQNDICGPAGDQECRGADSATEFTRQRDKIIAALVAMDADVYGLIEMENDTDNTAINNLVDGMNAATAPNTYAAVETGAVGSDAIRNGFIYNTTTIQTSGSSAVLDSNVDANFIDTKNRPVIAQTFEVISGPDTGEKFTAAVVHMKSKGSSCDDVNDPNLNDGAGNCNLTRTTAVQAMVNWLDGDPTSSGDTDFIVMGDFNAYFNETPIDVMTGNGFINQFGENSYSYVFDGEWGALDYVFANTAMNAQVVDRAKWNINADEPPAFDYNTFNQSGYYTSDPFRFSDHDPVLVGLDLGGTDTIPPTVISTTPINGAQNVAVDTTFSVTFSEPVIPTAQAANVVFSCDTQVQPTLASLVANQTNTTFTGTIQGNLEFGATCTLAVPVGAIVDASGNVLVDGDSNPNDNVFNLAFTTVEEPVTQPAITALSPEIGATNVPTDTQLTLTVSERVQVVGGGIELRCGNELQTLSKIAFDLPTLTYTFTVDGLLPTDSVCTYTVPTASIQDIDGDNLNLLDDADGNSGDGNYLWTFTTEPGAEITAFSPVDGATDVALDSNIVVTASENLVPVNLAALSFVCDGVPQTFPTLTQDTAPPVYTLDPVGGLPDSATCVLSLPSTALTDSTGNPLEDNDSNPNDNVVTLSFDTVVTAPVLTSSPADDATGVSTDTDFVVTLSEFPVTVVPENGPFTFICDVSNQFFDQVPNISQIVTDAQNNQFTLQFTNPLPSDAICVVTIPTDYIQDTDGNSLVDNDDSPNDNQLVITFSTLSTGRDVIATEDDTSSAPVIEGGVAPITFDQGE